MAESNTFRDIAYLKIWFKQLFTLPLCKGKVEIAFLKYFTHKTVSRNCVKKLN